MLVSSAHAQTRDSVVYLLAPSSRFEVKTGKAGLMSFAGHEHVIRARSFSGRIVHVPGAPAFSSVQVTVPTDSLQVMTPPDTAEIRKVTQAMRQDVLDVEHFPEIRLASRSVTATANGLRILTQLTMHGQSRDVPVEMRVQVRGDTLFASGTFSVKQTDFGMTPFRGGPGGTVRVADRVDFTIEAVGMRESKAR
ncbi:MAG TPA: YceI family protein [Gemmatimonadales bacterium]